MPAPGSVWAADSWDVDAWEADTWADAEVAPTSVTGYAAWQSATMTTSWLLPLLVRYARVYAV